MKSRYERPERLGTALLIASALVTGCATSQKVAPIPARHTPVNTTQADANRGTPKMPTKAVGTARHTEAVGKTVRQIALDLSSQKLAYGAKELTDCSGIFHRVLLGMKKHYPDEAFPAASQYRTTRLLAKWYYERNHLTLVRSPINTSPAIEPGMVLFYGQRTGGQPASGFTATDLFKPKTGINHMGVVVDVKRDAAGNVLEYGLFHGRRPGTVASVTRWHKRRSKPPFGNGRERWVAYAPIIPTNQAAH